MIITILGNVLGYLPKSLIIDFQREVFCKCIKNMDRRGMISHESSGYGSMLGWPLKVICTWVLDSLEVGNPYTIVTMISTCAHSCWHFVRPVSSNVTGLWELWSHNHIIFKSNLFRDLLLFYTTSFFVRSLLLLFFHFRQNILELFD